MTSLAWLLPAALSLGFLGLMAFLWALRDGQFDDLEAAGWRALEDGEPLDGKSSREAAKTRPPLNDAASLLGRGAKHG